MIVKRVRRCIRSSARLAHKGHCNEAENGEICERKVSPFRAEIAADMDIDVSNAPEETQATEAFYIGKTPPSVQTSALTLHHISRHYNKRPPTNIDTSRNSRPSFLIDDVRFWMRFSNAEHAPFTTPQTWHNRVWNNALKMKIRCQPKLCYSVAFLQLFDSSLTIQDPHSHT